MQPYLLSSTGRLRHWKDFRATLIEDQTDEEQLLLTAKYWQQFPTVDRYIDPYEPEKWFTSWEFIHNNEFCKSSLAFMMEQTLLMGADGRWNPDRLELIYVDDSELYQEFIVLAADNKYIINYSQDEVMMLDVVEKNYTIRHRYGNEGSIHKII